MSKVTPFPKAPSFQCRTVSQAEVIDIQALLRKTLAACPACAGRGQFPHKHPVSGLVAFSPCPCGGTDEDRIDLNDFGGAA
jgi:hypothetical protein